MSKMTPLARAYWALVCLLGLVALVLSQTLDLPRNPSSVWEVLAFGVLAFLVGGQKLSLDRRRKDEEAISMSLGFAITFACVLRLGPGPAVLIAVVSCLSSCLFPKRQPLHQLLFNVCHSAVEALVGGLVFAALNGGLKDMEPAKTFGAIAGSSLSFYFVNTVGVAVMISLVTRERLLKVWKENFSWTAPSYFASACVGALAMLLFSGSTAAVVLFVLPIAYLVYQSFGTYVARAEDKQQHIEALQGKQAELADLYLATIKSLALAIDAKDQYTHQHIIRVQRYAVAVAIEMGITGGDLEGVRTGALLHDIGKLGVPEYVLLKPGPLTPEEFEKVKQHPEIGAAILDPVPFPWPVLPVVRHHHEKWDGTGYPDGLAGENIPQTARILSVADAYDAITSIRSYRQALSHEKALELIREQTGRHFDPAVVEVFMRVIDKVVLEMAAEGTGPLVRQTNSTENDSKSIQAAKHISRASTELWALYEVAQSLSRSLGIKDTAELVVRKIEEIYPGATCVFFLRDPDTGLLVADSVYGVDRDVFLRAHTLSTESASAVALDKNLPNFGPFDPDDLELEGNSGTNWTPPKTALIVPVRCEGRPLGTINLYHPAEEAFSEHDRQLLELIADRAASALYNGILFDRTRGDSLSDPLTEVYNLRFLSKHVDALCEMSTEGATEGSRFAMLCLDLDSFKPINDGFGHAKGDTVLRDVAKLFADVVGSAGIIARSGGDEFVVVLDGADEVEAKQMADSLSAAIEAYDPQLHHHKLGQLRLGVSIGIGCYPGDGRDCASLLSAADHRMYSMKTERKLESLAKGSDHMADRAASLA